MRLCTSSANARNSRISSGRETSSANHSAKLHALVTEIRSAGGSAEWFALDVSRPEEMREFLAFAEDVHKRIDVVINNC